MSGQEWFALAGWFGLCIAASLFVCALAYALGERPYATYDEPTPVPAPRIPEQRQPTAAVVVEVTSPQTFEDFLAELILTPHVGDVLS